MFRGSCAAGRVADIPIGRLIIVAEHWKRQAVLVLSVMAEHHLKYSKNSCGGFGCCNLDCVSIDRFLSVFPGEHNSQMKPG